jgi:hypothetical protein
LDRTYQYEAWSLLESGNKINNRLTGTRVGNGVNSSGNYTYSDAQGNDVHGCMTGINAMGLDWDFQDQLQTLHLGGGGTAYYVYDSAGQRVRKVIHRHNGTKHKERLYLGGFEMYREYDGADTSPKLKRETLHIMDDKGLSLYNSINLNHLWRDRVVPLAVEDISLEVKGSHYII